MSIKDIRGVENTKVGRLLEKRCISKTFWYSGLSCISSKISSIF